MAAHPWHAVVRPRARRRRFLVGPSEPDPVTPPAHTKKHHRRRTAPPYRRVAVCLAPAEGSIKAVRVACTLAPERHAHLTAIAAIEVPLELPLDTPDQTASTAAHEAVHRAQALADSYGVPVEGIVLHARDAGEAIVAEVDRRKCELVVVAVEWPRSKGHVQRIGRTTDHILKHAPCRVMLIGRSAEQEAKAGRAGGDAVFPSSLHSDYWPTGEFIDRR